MAKNQLLWQDPGSIDRLDYALKSGEIVLISSDTVLGLSASLTLAGFEALNRIKGREKKPYLIILSDKRQLERYCSIAISSRIEQLMAQCWPGPLTLILPARPDIAPFLTRGGASIAIRIPAHAPLLELLSRVGGLFSTSANIAGGPIPETLDQVDPTILDQVGLVVTDGKEGSTTPSTLLDCTTDQIRLVRQGAYAISDLEKICGPIV